LPRYPGFGCLKFDQAEQNAAIAATKLEEKTAENQKKSIARS
jgi:hypothetical protein